LDIGENPCYIRLSRGYFPTGFTHFPHYLFIFSSLLIFLKLTAAAIIIKDGFLLAQE